MAPSWSDVPDRYARRRLGIGFGFSVTVQYVFLYYVKGSADPVTERRVLAGDAEARAKAASELLQMPAREGVEVWANGRLVHSRRRPGDGHSRAGGIRPHESYG